MKNVRSLVVAVVFAIFNLCSTARADTYLYSLTEGSLHFSFEVTSPPPITASDPTIGFATPVINSSITGAAYVQFDLLAQFGGFAFLDSDSNFVGGGGYSGIQLFTGTVDSPTLVLGAFTLANFDTNVEAQLVVTNLTAAVPEPSTWVMMILGFAGLSFMAYRKKHLHLCS